MQSPSLHGSYFMERKMPSTLTNWLERQKKRVSTWALKRRLTKAARITEGKEFTILTEKQVKGFYSDCNLALSSGNAHLLTVRIFDAGMLEVTNLGKVAAHPDVPAAALSTLPPETCAEMLSEFLNPLRRTPEELSAVAGLAKKLNETKGRTAHLQNGLADAVAKYVFYPHSRLFTDEIVNGVVQQHAAGLFSDPAFGQAALDGLGTGFNNLYCENTTDACIFCREISKVLPEGDGKSLIQTAMIDGVRAAEPPRLFGNMQTGNDLLLKLRLIKAIAPDLLSAFTPRHIQRMAHDLLSWRDSHSSDVAEIPGLLKDHPALAMAFAALPETKRMVLFPASEMETGYPMMVEATPRNGIRISTGCPVDETPEDQIEVWLRHRDDTRRSHGIPAIFEGVATLAVCCPYARRRQEAATKLDQLYTHYALFGVKEQLPREAQMRIEQACATVKPPQHA